MARYEGTSGDRGVVGLIFGFKDAVFCLTYRPSFFERFGFSQLDKMGLPQKVWNECFRCPKFPNCDEVALIYHLEVEA